MRHHGAIVEPCGPIAHGRPIAAESGPDGGVIGRAQIADRADAGREHARQGLAPDTEQARDGQGIENLVQIVGADAAKATGFSRSEAIFARSLFGATPTEAVNPRRSRMRRLIPAPMCIASPSNFWLAVTSRKASSSDRPSMSGVNSPKISNTWAETAA